MAGCLLCFDDCQDFAGWMEQTIVGNPVPRLFVVTVDRNLKIDLHSILEVPPGRGEQRIDQFSSRNALANSSVRSGDWYVIRFVVDHLASSSGLGMSRGN